MATSHREVHNVQHGFLVNAPAMDTWALPQLPTLHPTGDRYLAQAHSSLKSIESESSHPATPQQRHAQRPSTALSRHGPRPHHHHSHEKQNGTLLDDASFGIKKLVSMCASGSFSPKIAAGLEGSQPEPHLEVVGTVHASTDVRRLVRAVARGLRCCQEPQAAEAGLGGTYFFRSEAGAMVAIIKPCDEEPLAPNNPKGFVGRQLGEAGLKPTVRVGEAALREVAAFLLDHGGFAKVPPTVLVRCFHPIFHTNQPKSSSTASLMRAAGGSDDSGEDEPIGKLGSLQEFVAHEGDTSEVGASRFAAADVRRIGILDIRLFNTDRHAGNMLVVPPQRAATGGRAATSSGGGSALARLAETRSGLRPIDHGFCLPEALEPPYLEWLHWPQAMMPFTSEELAYIAALDAEADCELLARELPALRPECGRTLQVATLLLQRCSAAGLSLAEIGIVVSRPLVGLEEESSPLEVMCIAARASIDAAAAQGISNDSSDSDTESSSCGGTAPSDNDSDYQLADDSDDDIIDIGWHNAGPRANGGPLRASTFAGLGTVLTHGPTDSLSPLGEALPPSTEALLRGGVPVSSGSVAIPAWQPATMLSDIMSEDDDQQLPPLPPEWGAPSGAHSVAAPDGGIACSAPGRDIACSAPGQSSARGGLSAAFSSVGADLARLSIPPQTLSGRGANTPDADAEVAGLHGSGRSLSHERSGDSVVRPDTPTAVPPPWRPPLGLGRVQLSPSDSLSSVGTTSQPPSPLREIGGVAFGYQQQPKLRGLRPVRTSYGGDYCPLGGYASGTSSAEMGADSLGGHTLASSSSSSPIFGLKAGQPFGGHTYQGRPGWQSLRRAATARDIRSERPRRSAAGGGNSGSTASMAVPRTMLRGLTGDGCANGHHRRAAADATPHRSRRSAHRTKAKQNPSSAYPPPIEGRKPEAVNALFSGLSPQQWSDFMNHLRGDIEVALQSGCWRSDRRREQSGVPIGASCPRF